MFGLGAAAKWGAIVIIVGLLAAGINAGYNYHKDQITKAVNNSKIEQTLQFNKITRIREKSLMDSAIREKDKFEAELVVEKDKSNDLERMLRIEHDMDRLLQGRPDTMLRLANRGTVKYFKELEELTQ